MVMVMEKMMGAIVMVKVMMVDGGDRDDGDDDGGDRGDEDDNDGDRELMKNKGRDDVEKMIVADGEDAFL